MQDELPTFSYLIEPMPPTQLGRRWRWQLYRGERMLAAGWHYGQRQALGALRTATSRATHELAGLTALRPERATTDRRFIAGATVELTCGALRCTLTPLAARPT
ncbi:hypothetical protein [Conexibacter sp. CPCC 206217]|uniref:hypothetical protein n=1 Tax=Conexibacter sp. CPCC 206217 TaxID=3064574 RepID=UPI00271B9434|nr:hypothetical protein [Conexibacter sp. CPCC 206217]MDO8211071.1 hypothetical protein [Conexibacter sp. CPCC 206217]